MSDDESEGSGGSEDSQELPDDPEDTPEGEAEPKKEEDPLLQGANRPQEMRVVAPEERVTSDRIQLTEIAQLLAMRARMIERGQPCYVETGETHPTKRALLELSMGRCPLKLLRQVGEEEDGAKIYEVWNVNEMVLPEIPGLPEEP